MLYMKYYGMSRPQAEEAVVRYREYFSVKGLYENRVYDGIPELMSELRAAGMHLSVATSKPWIFSEKILERFELDGYFSFLSGSELDGTRVDKAEVIEYAIDKLGITDRSSVLMVGDRKHDIIGAHKCGIKAAGVLWGYGDRAEHEEYGADYIVDSIEELRSILI